MKEFLKEWKEKNVKKMGKSDRTNMLYDYLPMIVEFYIKKSHKSQEDVNQLFDRMEDERFVKTLSKILKSDDDFSPVDPGMATIIADFLQHRHANLSEDLIAEYSQAVDKILKKRLKKVGKKTGLSKDLLKELLVVVAEKDAVSDSKFAGIYVQRMLNKLYALSKDNDLGIEDTKVLRNLFEELFEADLITLVAVNILLERKENIKNFNDGQIAIWNVLTNFALDVIEKQKKSVVRELVEYFVSRRAKDAEKDRDSARRIQFTNISEEDYPKLTTVYAKLSEKEKFKKYL
jgi:hypothetical protein